MPVIPYANLHAEYLECKSDVDAAMTRCIANSSFIDGPEVAAFESAWATYTNSPACAGVSSGTSALMLALAAVGVGPGAEVIVPTMSFISTAEAVSQLGAIPVFADIDEFYTIDIDSLDNLITERTRAVIFVDLYGQTIDIGKLKSKFPYIPVIQDAAQSSVCLYQGQRIGNLVDATCFSFYPGKNLSAMGDAGAVTGSQEVIARIKMLRDHGRTEKYVHEIVGWNERLDGLQAAVLSAKLTYLDTWITRRQQNAATYFSNLHNVGDIDLPKSNPVSNHVYNQFVIRTKHRDALKSYLYTLGIETGVQFPIPMHQQPVYNSKVSLPRSESLAKTCLSLPVHAQCTTQDITRVCDTIKQFFS